jgi:hypothetical protein
MEDKIAYDTTKEYIEKNKKKEEKKKREEPAPLFYEPVTNKEILNLMRHIWAQEREDPIKDKTEEEIAARGYAQGYYANEVDFQEVKSYLDRHIFPPSDVIRRYMEVALARHRENASPHCRKGSSSCCCIYSSITTKAKGGNKKAYYH